MLKQCCVSPTTAVHAASRLPPARLLQLLPLCSSGPRPWWPLAASTAGHHGAQRLGQNNAVRVPGRQAGAVGTAHCRRHQGEWPQGQAELWPQRIRHTGTACTALPRESREPPMPGCLRYVWLLVLLKLLQHQRYARHRLPTGTC